VSKITKEQNCNVIFSPKNMIFQDIVTKRMIGEGKLDNDLYFLDSSNKALMANNVEDNKLWYDKLGHASDIILHKLISLKNLNNSNCDTCHFSKQTRLLVKPQRFLNLCTLMFGDSHMFPRIIILGIMSCLLIFFSHHLGLPYFYRR
jgi:GAG-pre-integrase domain